ncbi:hypothetical protein [Ramlibacter humi]|uniref:Uncharacterized protein n=1 Tax=Ramlibacter humi TaxID=2530451 RepID=A0A4Z0BFD5_9BURK|nr:hypothetical protein [Ramlibacter humi]TFY97027.1 hypothetical protein EZ216_19375 [Ramlibacter humi]
MTSGEYHRPPAGAGLLRAFAATFACGGVLTAGYCTLAIGFFPSGLTAGDLLLLLGVTLAFGTVHLAVCLAGYGAVVHSIGLLLRLPAFGARNLRDAPEPPVAQRTPAVFDAVLLLACAVLLAVAAQAFGNARLAGAGLLTGALLHLTRSAWSARRQLERAPEVLAICAIVTAVLPPLLFWPSFKCEAEAVMRRISLRSENVVIRVAQDSREVLEAAAAAAGVALAECSGDGEGASVFVDSVLWHGIGERTWVEMRPEAAVPVRAELRREDVFVVSRPGAGFRSCVPAQEPASSPAVAIPRLTI